MRCVLCIGLLFMIACYEPIFIFNHIDIEMYIIT